MQGKIGQMFFAMPKASQMPKTTRSLDAEVAAELSYDWVRRTTSLLPELPSPMELREFMCDCLWDLTQPGGHPRAVHIGQMKDKLPDGRMPIEWCSFLLRPPTPNQLRALAMFLRADSRILHAASVVNTADAWETMRSAEPRIVNTADAWEAVRSADPGSQTRRGASP